MAESKQDAEAKKTPSVSPATLVSEYKANEVAADGKYKGSGAEAFKVRWTRSLRTSPTQFTSRSSRASRFEILSVQCFFDDKFTAKAAQLSPGQAITVIGKCNGKFGNVLIKECEFVD